jgi:outer membrane protein OmpA-like peptidoglycan-associated protein
MKKFLLLFALLAATAKGQSDTVYLKAGDKAPSFILDLYTNNSIQSFIMPYLKRIALLHFWSTESYTSKMQNKFLTRLSRRYRNSMYKNAEGFEIIAIAVQPDKEAWKNAITDDSLTSFIHGIATKGLADEVCRKYGVIALPTDILVDENGIVVAIDPRINEIENFLDEQKNNQPLRKDITGLLAESSDKNFVMKYGGVYLLNYYGDTLVKTTTNEKGIFRMNEIKLNQDLYLKVDNKTDINTTDPIALYTADGAFLTDGRTRDEGFVFSMPARLSNKLIAPDTTVLSADAPTELDITKSLSFTNDGTELTKKDEDELSSIVSLLTRNSSLLVEITTHTDARMDHETALNLTAVQANTLKNFLVEKGVAGSRVQTNSRGNTELRKICEGTIDCREEDHRLNRRVEFFVHKN